MYIKHKEFDRTFFKTHQSRSIKFSSNKSFGFTLIELLVVISIIALLSTIVLTAVNDARVKARNTAKNSLALQYINALELYKSDYGSYPVSGSSLIRYCFGYNSLEQCFGDTSYGLNSLQTSLQPYLPGDFKDTKSINTHIGDLKGFTYICTGTTNCNSYEIEWILEKNSTKCINKSTTIEDFFSTGHTYCAYSLN